MNRHLFTAVILVSGLGAAAVGLAEEYRTCIKKSDWSSEGYYYNNVKWDAGKSSTDPTNFKGPPPDNWTGKVTFKRNGNVTESWTVQNGKVLTYEKWDDTGKVLNERWTYKDNCAHGKIRRDVGSYWIDANYQNGYERGVQVRYDESTGKIDEEWTVGPDGKQGVTAKYDPAGNLTSLECDPPVSDAPKLKVLCGLNGKQSVVKLYQTRDGKPYVWKQLGYLNGKKHGVETVYNESGKAVATVNYKNGEKDGIAKSDGTSYGKYGASTVPYVNGKLEGKETRLFKGSKDVQFEIVWKAGEVVSDTEYYQNGHKKVSRRFRNGKIFVTTYNDDGKKDSSSVVRARSNWWGSYYVPDGKVIHYGANGEKSYEASYKNGERHGTTTYFFYDSKKVSQKETWEHGDLKSRTEYTQDGKADKITEFFPDGSKKVKKP